MCHWVVAHTFNPSTWRQRQRDLCEFEAIVFYSVRSRTARDTQKNPVSKNQKTKRKKKHVSHSNLHVTSAAQETA